MIYAIRLEPKIKFVEKFSTKRLARAYRESRKRYHNETIILVKEPEKKRLRRAIEKNENTSVLLAFGGNLSYRNEELKFYGKQQEV